MNKVLAVLALVVLVGCQTTTRYEDKNVPVYMVPEPPRIERPELPIHELQRMSLDVLVNPSDAGRVAKAYAVTVRLLMNWGRANQEIVDAYYEMSQEDFTVSPMVMAVSNPQVFGSVASPEEAQAQALRLHAEQTFSEIVDKYNQRKEEILTPQ